MHEDVLDNSIHYEPRFARHLNLEDHVAPVFPDCPPDLEYDTDEGQPGAVVDFAKPEVTNQLYVRASCCLNNVSAIVAFVLLALVWATNICNLGLQRTVLVYRKHRTWYSVSDHRARLQPHSAEFLCS